MGANNAEGDPLTFIFLDTSVLQELGVLIDAACGHEQEQGGLAA
jgi:hypothetical protein